MCLCIMPLVPPRHQAAKGLAQQLPFAAPTAPCRSRQRGKVQDQSGKAGSSSLHNGVAVRLAPVLEARLHDVGGVLVLGQGHDLQW